MHDALFLVCCRLVTMGLLFCSMLLILNNLCASKPYLPHGRTEYPTGITVHKQTQWPVHNSVHESPQQFFPWLIQEPAIQNSLASKISHQTFDWVNIISDLVSFFNINELCKTLSGPKEWRKNLKLMEVLAFQGYQLCIGEVQLRQWQEVGPENHSMGRPKAGAKNCWVCCSDSADGGPLLI